MNRKLFVKSGLQFVSGATFIPLFGKIKSNDDAKPMNTAIIKEFVGAGHRNLDKVKEMHAEMPTLIYSSYDWGDGDFEEAIEGAGHVGNKEIANFLIQQGARANLFVLTMLGKTDLVKPVLEAYPKLIFAKGPHGFTMLHHAVVGGPDAEELHEYLFNKGLSETKVNIRS